MYVSRVKWNNPGINSYRKGSLLDALDYGRQLYFILLASVNHFFFFVYTFNFDNGQQITDDP